MILYVSQDHKDTAAVFAFEGNLRRQGLLREKIATPLSEIRARAQEAARNENQIQQSSAQSLGLARDLIERAISMRASDIHIEIYEDSHCLVKYRIDSYLRPIMEILPHIAHAMVMAMYNVSEGKNKMEWMRDEICFARLRHPDVLPKGLFAIRFSSTRMSGGQFITLRMLPKGTSSASTLEEQGINKALLKTLKSMLRAASGLVVITGPTGAGKSTLLKHSIEWLQSEFPYSNTITVEDPVEYPIKNAKQIDVLVQDNEDPSVDERAIAWSRVISTTLRLDPDRIMVGEIRDGAAAMAACRAAFTGHPTLTTSHTNDAWEALNRVVDLLREGGMLNPMSLLANTKNFVGATAQRLVPRLCDCCRIPLVSNEDRIGGKTSELFCDLAQAVPDFSKRAHNIFLRGDGCNKCVPEFADRPDAQRLAPGAGIYGRALILEVVKPTQRHLDIAMSQGTPAARRQWLEDGGQLMIDDAIEKVCQGVITPEIVQEFIGEIKTSRQLIEQYRSGDRSSVVQLAEVPRPAVVPALSKT
jgi:type II secretory ATPase GspE/PulE/Tfp pilus assembly ATPase PilB-like protein